MTEFALQPPPSIVAPAARPRASWQTWILSRLRRVTTSGRFIPEVDGLRFVAIAGVILFHVYGQVVSTNGGSLDPARKFDVLSAVAAFGGYGVSLFFAISGFILGVPFAEHYLNRAPPVRLGRYFLRRVTRLEPPFVICVVALTLLLLVVPQNGDGHGLLSRFLASITYSHRLAFRDVPPINTVTWSLEIEVQFYLAAPLLALLYRVRPALLRRSLLVGAALCTLLLVEIDINPPNPRLPLLEYLHYFLIGMLLADLYVTDWRERPATRHAWVADVVVAVSLVGFLVIANLLDGPNIRRCFLALLPAIFFGCAGVLRGQFFRRLLANPWIAVTGGMCYTIYLYHKVLLHLMYMGTSHITVGRSLWANVLLQLLLFTLIMLPVMAVLYVLFERPFMQRDWPIRFYNWLRGRRAASGEQTSAALAPVAPVAADPVAPH